MLLCCGWNRRREKFGLLHIVCKTVQLRAFFEGRDQLVSGEQTAQFWCNLQKKTDKKNYSNNSISIILAEIGRHVLLVSSQNRLLSRSGDNGGIVDVYLPGLVIEHSCSFFDNYRLTLVIDIPKFTQFSFIYLWTERIVVGIVKLRHERASLSHSN